MKMIIFDGTNGSGKTTACIKSGLKVLTYVSTMDKECYKVKRENSNIILHSDPEEMDELFQKSWVSYTNKLALLLLISDESSGYAIDRSPLGNLVYPSVNANLSRRKFKKHFRASVRYFFDRLKSLVWNREDYCLNKEGLIKILTESYRLPKDPKIRKKHELETEFFRICKKWWESV